MIEEDDYLMLSGIQHYQFCRRQWALIHIEQQWAENVKTVEGQFLHSKADQPFLREKRGNKLVVRGMPVKSSEMGISGVCDVVEFIKDDAGVEIHGEEGSYIPFPVEYKRGKPKVNDADVLQLTAQAMCLEEMMVCSINMGFVYYHEIKHRIEVPLTKETKNKVKEVIAEMHSYYSRRYTPKAKTGPYCQQCSLNLVCLPEIMHKRSVNSYVEGKLLE